MSGIEIVERQHPHERQASVDQQTYDPILESQTLPRLRVFSPLRPPPPGTALVLVPYEGSPITILHGEPIPGARGGTHHRMFLVDVCEHRLALQIPLLSKDASFAFPSRVELVCRVAEPADVVTRGIRDVSGALYGHMKRMLRQVSRDYDIAEFHEAEQALNAAVRTFTGDSAIRLRNVHVELLVDEDELVTSGREFRDIKRDTRLSAMRRERHLAMLDGRGVEALVAEIVESEGPRAALELIASMESAERAELMKALDTVLTHSDPHREPFDLLEAERTVLDRVVEGSAAPFGGTRPGRLRGSLAAGELRAGRGEESDGRVALGRGGDARSGKASGEPVKSPVPGEVVARPASIPPEDEPAGGAKIPDDSSGSADNEPVGDRPQVSRVRGASRAARNVEAVGPPTGDREGE